jgi:hypothetical protein
MVKKASCAYAAKMLVHQQFPLVRAPEYYDANRNQKDVVIPEYGKSARELWIQVSNEVMEKEPLKFLDIVMEENRRADFLVISDLRYIHMGAEIVRRSGLCYKIIRDVPKHEGLDRQMDNFTAWAKIIDNNCSMSDLNYQMGEICDELLEGALT